MEAVDFMQFQGLNVAVFDPGKANNLPHARVRFNLQRI